jgi:hypothetical protein
MKARQTRFDLIVNAAAKTESPPGTGTERGFTYRGLNADTVSGDRLSQP